MITGNWPFKAGTLQDVCRQLQLLSGKIFDRTLQLMPNVGGAVPVQGVSVVLTANTGATNITGFAGGHDTGRLVVIAGDTHTTLVHSAALFLKSGANVPLTWKQTKNFVASAAPTSGAINWLEI
jgi:hypothetical protein